MHHWVVTTLLRCNDIVITLGVVLRQCRDSAETAQGELAQMVERSLSMREVAGSMTAFSKELFMAALISAVVLFVLF